jgi:glutathione synthase/RimK-type ligase-like ATP-grasp enzyme
MWLIATVLHLALLTSDQYPPSQKIDDQLLMTALQEHAIEAESIDWRASNIDWTAYDAVMVYSTWDYYEDHPQFINVLKKIESLNIPLYNPCSIIEWNSRKTYLQDLKKLGLKTLESVYIPAQELGNLESILIEKGWDDCVIKPQISTSAHHIFRLNRSNLSEIQSHLKELNEDWILQPFAPEIVSEGEWSFVFFDKEYLHCALKKPAPDHFVVQTGQKIPIQPPEWMIQEAQHIVDTLNLPALQTRVDLIRRGDEVRIMEIEMVEPSLYLRYFPGSEKHIAEKINQKLRSKIPAKSS